jgi:hypothetical protein
MKLIVTLEQQIKHGAGWRPTESREYMVRIPNYQSPDTDELYSNVKAKLEKDGGKFRFVATGYHLYSDNSLTMSERSQLDLEGEIKHSPIEIKV